MIWNAGGWFGGLIGLVAWMAVAAVVVGIESPIAAVGPAVGCLVTAGAGWALWRGRLGIRVERALLVLIGVAGICGLGAMVWIDASGQLDALWVMTPGGPKPAWAAYAALLAYPLLALVIWRRERAASTA